MIRVNLLSQERAAASASRYDLVQLVPIVCGLVLLLTAAGIGWWYWSLDGEAARLDQEIAEAQREQDRLQSILVQVTRFETRKSALEQRVSLIEELRRDQSGPVHMLDELSRSLPDRLWLTELNEEESDLTIQGQASSLTALSDFVANLEASPYFRRPVEILNSQVEPQVEGDLIRFTVKAGFQLPGA